MNKINESLKESDKAQSIRRDVLFTSVGTKHIGFYMKYGMMPQHLTYIATFDIHENYNALIKKKDSMLNKIDAAYTFKDVFSKFDDKSIAVFASSAKTLTNRIYEGLDIAVDIYGFANSNDLALGTCVALYDNKEATLSGFAVLSFGNESGCPTEGRLKIKFAAATDDRACAVLLYHIIEYGKKRKMEVIEAGINMGRTEAFSIMTENIGFEFDASKPFIAMGKCAGDEDGEYDDYNTRDAFVIGDWRL